jgi:hypothetical protein
VGRSVEVQWRQRAFSTVARDDIISSLKVPWAENMNAGYRSIKYHVSLSHLAYISHHGTHRRSNILLYNMPQSVMSHSPATQLFGAQLFAHENAFPALPRASSVPEDHMPSTNCALLDSSRRSTFQRVILTIVTPNSMMKQFSTVKAALRFVANSVPLCWYSQKIGGRASEPD